jgi:hypothetical protein
MDGYLPPLAVLIVSTILIAARQRVVARQRIAGQRSATESVALALDVAIAIAIIAVAAGVLFAMGRTPSCKCGVIRIWAGNIWSNENSQQLADPYTFTHLTHGIALYALFALVPRVRRLPLRLRLLWMIAAESAWEVFENTDMVIERYRAATLALDYYGDSILNSVGDILACIAGFALAARLPTRATIVLAVILEVTLALWIRDGLVLNVLMLLYPIAAVKRWQMGP